MGEEQVVNITEDEAALYDRQIRLWGLDAQKRLRAARALLVGVSGLGAEVAKNIVLSGIKSLTLLDDTQVTKEDACSQFLVSRSDVGKNRAECSLQRAQQLNPMVEVTCDNERVSDKPDDFFKQFDVVCVTCCSPDEMVRINQTCHKNNIMFFAGDVFGYYGYMFSDLNDHEFAEDVPAPKQKDNESANGEPPSKKSKSEENQMVTVMKELPFVRLKSTLDVDWSTEDMVRKLKRTPSTHFITQVLLKFRSIHGRDPGTETLESDKEELKNLRKSVMESLKVKTDIVPDDFYLYCFAELSPVCAVVGGVLGQEIIKAVSKKDTPHRNYFFFNGVEGSGMVDCIGC